MHSLLRQIAYAAVAVSVTYILFKVTWFNEIWLAFIKAERFRQPLEMLFFVLLTAFLLLSGRWLTQGRKLFIQVLIGTAAGFLLGLVSIMTHSLFLSDRAYWIRSIATQDLSDTVLVTLYGSALLGTWALGAIATALYSFIIRNKSA
jgi:hypothetical protein